MPVLLCRRGGCFDGLSPERARRACFGGADVQLQGSAVVLGFAEGALPFFNDFFAFCFHDCDDASKGPRRNL